MPVFRLDRIYARGLSIVDAHMHYAYPGRRISDHARYQATFDLKWKRR
jgi:endonuclease/exonuclease/phosphatase family metal-dependent hydrolase